MLIDFAIIWAPECLFGKLCLRGCSVYTSQWKLLLFPLLSEKLKIDTTYRENVNLEAWGKSNDKYFEDPHYNFLL